MDKSKILGHEMTSNEGKTIAAFVEIENGAPELVKRSLDEICKKTKLSNSKEGITDPGYQSALLKKLRNEKMVGRDKEGYFLKSKYKNIAYSLVIQNKIKSLEKKGLFMFRGFTVFGIEKDWMGYPEAHYLHEVILDCCDIQYRIKQIKSIFLIRDFSKTWKNFLDMDIHPAVKYWIWQFVAPLLLSFHDRTDQAYLDKQVEVLSQFEITDDILNEYKDKIKKQCEDLREKVRKDFKKTKLKNNIACLFGEKIVKKLDDYSKIYMEAVGDYVTNVLTDEQEKRIIDILKWVTVTYPNEVNNIGVYTDIDNLLYNPLQLYSHMKIPLDYEEKFFRRYHDKITISEMERVTKDLNIETIDDSLKGLFDINDRRNYDRFYDRLILVIAHEIEEPKSAVFTTPELEKIRKEIARLAKTEKSISSLIAKGRLRSDDDIFFHTMKIQQMGNSALGLLCYVKLLEEKQGKNRIADTMGKEKRC